MDTRTCFQHVTLYGQTAREPAGFHGEVPEHFTLNSPVGVAMDRLQRIWICDTGNNRVLVLDQTLSTILQILQAPAPDSEGPGALEFRMPFHVCAHPDKNLMFITDMGNGRVVVMEYAARRFGFAFAFGDQADNAGSPLQDPNGIALVLKPGGGYHVHVNDEFYHTETDKMRNRCVRYDEHGKYVDEFRTVIDPDGSRHDLYWPQGLSADASGNLYLANTGSYEVLKCASDAKIDADYCLQGDKPVVAHRFGPPSGMAVLNIMRDVNVIGKHVFVPDHVANTISVYDLNGKLRASLSGMRPSWNHGDQPIESVTDPLYYAIENAVLYSPYAICQGEAPDIFFVSEPMCSRIVKLRITGLDEDHPQPAIEMITSLGARRDQPGGDDADPMFNCLTAITALAPRKVESDTGFDLDATLPDWIKFNPLQRMFMTLSENLTRPYALWFDTWMRPLIDRHPVTEVMARGSLILDAGNWRIKACLSAEEQLLPADGRVLDGCFIPGDLGMAVYHPKTALSGQVCPGSPLLLVGNFNTGEICLYQVDPLGKLLNYGLPFGIYGQGEGCMRGPQGMAVSADGEVFIVDSLNNRIAKWQILQTGQVVFIKNFRWDPRVSDRHPAAFAPCDVALDANNRVVVVDQYNNRICVFDRNGNDLWCYGQQGYWEEGDPDGSKFMLPTSLAIDGEFLVLNDLVNRALKLFRIEDRTLSFVGGISLFKLSLPQGGVWMPFFMTAHNRQVQIADMAYNVVQVFKY